MTTRTITPKAAPPTLAHRHRGGRAASRVMETYGLGLGLGPATVVPPMLPGAAALILAAADQSVPRSTKQVLEFAGLGYTQREKLYHLSRVGLILDLGSSPRVPGGLWQTDEDGVARHVEELRRGARFVTSRMPGRIFHCWRSRLRGRPRDAAWAVRLTSHLDTTGSDPDRYTAAGLARHALYSRNAAAKALWRLDRLGVVEWSPRSSGSPGRLRLRWPDPTVIVCWDE